jgi:hypothetical protein
MSKVSIVKICPVCEKVSQLSVDSDKYNQYMQRKDLIQNVFPELNPAQREFIMTGYCSDCQHIIFGSNYTIEEEER